MADDGSRGKVWIIADELPVLRRQAELETLVVRGRKRGLCAVLGLQAITQLRAIYGHDQTATLAAAPATKLILRTGEADTARWSSAQIGEREVTRGLVGQSTRLGESRDGFTIHPHRQVESVALASEIQMLRPFEGYLCITGYRRAKVMIPYLAPFETSSGVHLSHGTRRHRSESGLKRQQRPRPCAAGKRDPTVTFSAQIEGMSHAGHVERGAQRGPSRNLL